MLHQWDPERSEVMIRALYGSAFLSRLNVYSREDVILVITNSRTSLIITRENNHDNTPLLLLGKQKLAKSKVRFVTSFLMYSIWDKEFVWRMFVYLLYLSNVTRFYCVFDFSKIVTTIAIPMVINAGFPQNVMFFAQQEAKATKTSDIVFVLASFSCISFTLG